MNTKAIDYDFRPNQYPFTHSVEEVSVDLPKDHQLLLARAVKDHLSFTEFINILADVDLSEVEEERIIKAYYDIAVPLVNIKMGSMPATSHTLYARKGFGKISYTFDIDEDDVIFSIPQPNAILSLGELISLLEQADCGPGFNPIRELFTGQMPPTAREYVFIESELYPLLVEHLNQALSKNSNT